MDIKMAIDYLSKDKMLHIDMLEGIDSGKARVLFSSSRGVLVYFENAETYMMSAEDKETADRMIGNVSKAPMFVAHQDFYIPALQEKFSFKERVICHNVAYFSKKPLPEPSTPFAIRRLDASSLPFLMKHYSRANDEEYIRERLESGVVFGAFCEKGLAGFIGLHAEGSMGMLEVLPEFRRAGVATALETFMANRLLSQGHVPYAQVVTDNTASINLNKKLGFNISEKTLSWLM